ncbi:MAG: lysophospholipid acyltransferase family protein [Lentisphaerae bacterium]|nr:lysophospholipid acyltransferase family protein [Lentisphaerota bacterium]
MADRVLALDQLSQVYQTAADEASERPFADRALDALQAAYELPGEDRQRIPATGPLVVVANHSFGGIEGLILLSLLQSVRPDVRVMANYLLHRIPDMRDSFIFVDPFGRPDSPRANSRPLRESLRWLKRGGVLGVFPSGEVARLNLRQGGIAEPPWSETIAGLIRATGAPVLPIYFDGTNGPLFHVLGLIHPRLRTALLPRQFCNKRQHRIAVRIGNVIPPARLTRHATNRDLIDYLRTRTYLLRGRMHSAADTSGPNRPAFWFRARPLAPIAPPVPPATLAANIAALPPDRLLTASGDFEVWYARAPEIPAILREIGRLREVTFRAVGEGGGHALDLDRFDTAYIHLFMWNRREGELIGAYRIGPTDLILPERGAAGLYTSTLFRLDRRLLESLNPALELGRSFVRQEYQRNYQSLYMIWKGLAAYVLRHPHYRILFGPVSISSQYQSLSRDLMVAFLRLNNSLPTLARQARPRKPVHDRRRFRPGVANPIDLAATLEDIEDFIADVENELQGIPILLKQYLKLGGKMLGFNRDPKFGNCLDGLILVDLVEANHKILGRYMGEDGLRRYLAHHGAPAKTPETPSARPRPSRADAAPG